MSAVISLDATYEIAEEAVGELLQRVEAAIGRRSAQIACLLIAGEPDLRIRQQLGLTAREYREAVGCLRATFRPT